jgi:hypothetical protein
LPRRIHACATNLSPTTKGGESIIHRDGEDICEARIEMVVNANHVRRPEWFLPSSSATTTNRLRGEFATPEYSLPLERDRHDKSNLYRTTAISRNSPFRGNHRTETEFPISILHGNYSITTEILIPQRTCIISSSRSFLLFRGFIRWKNKFDSIFCDGSHFFYYY